ncbi:MAG: hypothetical protein RLZZ543_1839 [Bacteroidota bacterium]|jgi:hypothetical protein
MEIASHIETYFASLPAAKQNDMRELHRVVLELNPSCQLWFLDGKNEAGKVVSNPNVGYGLQTLEYAKGAKRDFYQVGISANSTGISVYIIGISDKNYLKHTFENRIGKASITGYCIKFKSLKDVALNVLIEAIQCGFEIRNA